MSLKVDILKKSRELFYKNGYSKVTVDEIALGLGISKKTIYKYYSGKQQILEMIFFEFKKVLSGEVSAVLDNTDLSYPEKLKQMMMRVAVALSGMSPVFFVDIQDNFPDLWDQINRYKQDAAFLRFNRLIDEGINKGYIKEGINKNMVVALYASAINNLLDPHFLYQLPDKIKEGIPQYPAEIFDHALHIIYEGILTDDAINNYQKD
ncbi:TetR/AcrR family transcriptional regulator [Bacteroidota bacterium]